MDINQLRYFQTVARTGNMSRAARELYITQPNLSRSISRLEAELGVPLFSRRKGKVELNDYGRVYLSSVDIAFAELTSGAQIIRRMYDSNQNILTLACDIERYLAMLIPKFALENPGIGIRQLDYTNAQIIDHLLNHEVSLGITKEPIENPSIACEVLDRTRFVLAVSSSLALADARSVSIADLRDQHFICDSSRFDSGKLRELCRSHGIDPTISYEIQSSDMIIDLLETTDSVTIISLPMGCDLLIDHPDAKIKLLEISDPVPPLHIAVSHLKSVELSAAARRFIRFLQQQLEEEHEMITALGYAHLIPN